MCMLCQVSPYNRVEHVLCTMWSVFIMLSCWPSHSLIFLERARGCCVHLRLIRSSSSDAFFPTRHLDATWLLGLKIPDGAWEQSRHCCHRNKMLSQLYAAAILFSLSLSGVLIGTSPDKLQRSFLPLRFPPQSSTLENTFQILHR